MTQAKEMNRDMNKDNKDMTQVKEWSNQELNRKLAELMGYWVDSKKIGDGSVFYRLISQSGKPETTWRGTEEIPWLYAPYYCTDPAASLEVQTAAIVKDPENYMRNLVAVRWARQEAAEMKELSLVGAADLHLASPRERAEAAYITLSSKQ